MFDEFHTSLLELTNAELDEQIRTNELERRRLDAEQASLIAVAEHRRVYADDDHRSINSYLKATLNCSGGDASRLRCAARVVDRVDGVGESWMSGRVGVSHIAQFASLVGNRRVRDRLPEAAPLLVDNAEQLSFADFTLCVDRFVNNVDVDGAHDGRDDAVEHRTASVVDVGGTLDVCAHGGDGVTTAEIIAIFERFCEAEYDSDLAARRAEHGDLAERHPLPRTARQRAFDAVVSIFRTANEARREGRPSDVVVNILIDAGSWTELLTHAGLTPDEQPGLDPELIPTLIDGDVPLEDRRCETSTGIQLHPHDVLRAALAGHVRRVVVDSAGVVIDLGRRQRLFTGAARQAAMLLARHCEHPGCDLPADWCNVDHQHEWADGGTTDQTNAGIRCGRHNTTKTVKRWQTRRDTRGHNHTIRADGTIIIPVGVRPPTFPDEDSDDDTPEEIARLEQHIRNRVRALRAA